MIFFQLQNESYGVATTAFQPRTFCSFIFFHRPLPLRTEERFKNLLVVHTPCVLFNRFRVSHFGSVHAFRSHGFFLFLFYVLKRGKVILSA